MIRRFADVRQALFFKDLQSYGQLHFTWMGCILIQI
jgi:hypothetical protein